MNNLKKQDLETSVEPIPTSQLTEADQKLIYLVENKTSPIELALADTAILMQGILLLQEQIYKKFNTVKQQAKVDESFEAYVIFYTKTLERSAKLYYELKNMSEEAKQEADKLVDKNSEEYKAFTTVVKEFVNI